MIYEVIISHSFFVEAKSHEEAKQKAQYAYTTKSKNSEYGGMKVNSMISDKKKISVMDVHADKVAGRKEKYVSPFPIQKGTYGKGTQRVDRSVGKEQEYIDFSTSDGV